MFWVPRIGALRWEDNTGDVGTGTPGTSVSTSGTASVKGTETTLIASTAFDAYWLEVVISNYGVNAGASDGSVDILRDGEIIISDLLMGGCGAVNTQGCGPKIWLFPLIVPAGSELSAQAAGIRLSTACRVWVHLYGGDGVPMGRWGTRATTLGMGTVPNGTPITAGASGAEGSWTELEDSTVEDYFALVPSFQIITETSVANRALQVDVGVGASGSERSLGRYWYHTDAGELMGGPFNPMPILQSIPAGSRIAMRASNQGTNDTYDGVVHAVS